MFRAWLRFGAAASVACLLAGCSAKSENPARADAAATSDSTVDPKAVQAVTAEAETDLNTLAFLIHDVITNAAQLGQITSDQLTIEVEGETLPIDWWLWNQGLIELRGESSGQPVFGLTSAGVAAAAQSPPWFALAASSPNGKCAIGQSVTQVSCSVAVQYSVTNTTSGAAIVPKLEVPGFSVETSVTSANGTWEVAPFDGDSAPRHIARDALLGPPEGREAARTTFVQAVVAQARAGAQSPQATSSNDQ